MRKLWFRIYWPLLQALDRRRLRRLKRLHPGLEIHPDASANLAMAEFELDAGARLVIGAGVFTERRRCAVRFRVGAGSEMIIGEGTWLYTDLGTVRLRALDRGRLVVGPRGWLHGCTLSAKARVELGEHVWVGPGSRVFDSDQHALDDQTPERREPVFLRDHTWIGSDVTVMRGVEIGAHSVIGTRSLVTRSFPPHTLAFGNPAEPRGTVGDRSKV